MNYPALLRVQPQLGMEVLGAAPQDLSTSGPPARL